VSLDDCPYDLGRGTRFDFGSGTGFCCLGLGMGLERSALPLVLGPTFNGGVSGPESLVIVNTHSNVTTVLW
jgi:hypothetical protein